MRLLDKEISTILAILKSYSESGKVFLHGSRMDDTKKGGDIDLFFVVNDSDSQELSRISHKIAAELSLRLNEQKVDLIILGETDSKSHDFFQNSEKSQICS